MSDFNLVDDPFIPVQALDGTVEELSLRQVLIDAPRLRGLGGEVPTQAFALLRVLLACLYRAAEVYEEKDWRQLWHDGPPVGRIDAYLKKFRPRFSLFGAEPFFQVAGLSAESGKVDGLEKIIVDVPNGHQFFTTRRGRGIDRISVAEAARWLIHTQAFDPSGIRSGAAGDSLVRGGKGYPIGPSWAGQIGGLVVHGMSLWETLLLNLVPLEQADYGLLSTKDDLPPWEDDQDTALREDFSEKSPPGVVSSLTWQSRRVRLVGDREGVTHVVLCQGDKLTPHNRFSIETMTTWRYSKPQSSKAGHLVYMPRKHDADRAFWRNVPGVLPAGSRLVDGHDATRAAAVLRWAGRVAPKVGVDHVRLQAVGITYGPQEATVEEMVADEQELHLAMLLSDSTELAVTVENGIQLAEQAVRLLGDLARDLAQAAGDSGADAGSSTQAQVTAEAFQALDLPARRWLAGLDGNTDHQLALQDWSITLQREISRLADRLVREASDAGAEGRVLERTTREGGKRKMLVSNATADVAFVRRLRRLLPTAYPDQALEPEATDNVEERRSPALSEGGES